MGLRMFIEPEAAEPKTTTKVDPTAAARSSIRRQRTVRYSPHVRDHQSTLNTLLSRTQTRLQGRAHTSADRRSLLEDVRRSDRSAASPAVDINDSRTQQAEADVAHSEASQRSRLESGRALLRDALSYERPGRRRRIARENTILEAQARVRRSPLGLDDVENPRTSSRSPPPGYMPTPPYTSGDISSGSSPYMPAPAVGTASFTPGFAPAHTLDRQDEDRANLEREDILSRISAQMAEMSDPGDREFWAGHRAEINRMRGRNPVDITPEYREAEASILESIQIRLDVMRRMRDHDISELPPLRRTRRPPSYTTRPPEGLSQRDLDGLGDRERSFSPDDQWETMLTTIQPDERIPSAHSSFTSATASSSSLSSNPVSSYGTLVTAPSTTTDVEACPADFDDSDDDPIDIISAQISQTESQARRIESLSQRLSHQQSRDEHTARRQRMLEREEELRQLETNLRRLERQISEEQPVSAARLRRDGVRSGRERL